MKAKLILLMFLGFLLNAKTKETQRIKPFQKTKKFRDQSLNPKKGCLSL